MKIKYSFALLLFFITLIGCSVNKQEKYQTSRKNIQNIKEQIVVFETDSILIGQIPVIYLAKEFLIVQDYKSLDKYIHIFDKFSFKHIASTALRGEGPDEITRIGHIVYDELGGNIYVSDHGKNKIFCYNLDSVIKYPDYKHYVKTKMKDREFPSKYFYINDSLSYARIILPTGNSGFNEILAKWSYTTGKTIPLFNHLKIEKRRVVFTVSPENDIYVECYFYHDLLTICDLDGNLKHNVYGPNWDENKSNKTCHFQDITVLDNNIIASYSGGKNFSKEDRADKLLVFNLNGDYVKTLDVGYRISDMCYDKESKRLYFSFNDMIQFGYLELTDEVLK
jgi:hypothetical protein